MADQDLAPETPDTPEHWDVRCPGGDVAVLTIPADARRERRFEITCRFVVARRGDAPATHAMTVEVDGAHEWTREAATENPGHTDSLDYHFRRDVPAGQDLRIVAKTRVDGAQRVDLGIEAEESRA
jgi:hypothetical protein